MPPTLIERLAEQGIRLSSHGAGEHYAICPQCSATRKAPNRKKPCLGVKVDDDELGATWNCFNCEWKGNIPAAGHSGPAPSTRRRRPTPTRPVYRETALPEHVVKWFAGRSISEATLVRNRIGFGPAYIYAHKKEVPCIQFPYFRDNEVANIKFRTLDKNFAQVKDAEKVFYGLDDVADCREIVITEGEVDKLSLEEAGYTNVLSVPTGAPEKVKAGEVDPEDDRKFEYLWAAKDQFAGVEKFILATDADEPGRALAEELARRLGRERCWTVAWPTINDAPRKDANDVLVNDGADVLREVIEAAEPYPIRGLHSPDKYREGVLALYRTGRQRAHSTGWRCLDPYMTIRECELSTITGMPGDGKSEFVDAMITNLAENVGWRFAICSFENPPEEHLSKLAEKRLRMPFWEGRTPRMGEGDLAEALDWIEERFVFIRPGDDDAPTIEWILEQARSAVLRYGIRGLVIDPYNEIEHKRPLNMTETEYVSQILGQVKRFAAAHGVHVWFVAHPAKLRREDGKIPVPTLYDISGSANWSNKTDLGVVVYRLKDRHSPTTEIYVRKVRFKSVGKIGKVALRYDPATGCYSDPADAPQGTRSWLPD